MKYYVSRDMADWLTSLKQEMKVELEKLGNIAKSGGNNIILENPYFMEERARIMANYDKRIKEMSLYQGYIIIEDMDEYKNFDGTSVIIGSKIDLKIDDSDETYWIKGSKEMDIDKGIMSCESPLSQVLLGKKVGEEFDFRGAKIKILSVSL